MNSDEAQASGKGGPLPCPWCGCVGVTADETSTYRWAAAICNECGVVGPEIRKGYSETKPEWEPRCIAAWNDRPAARAALMKATGGEG